MFGLGTNSELSCSSLFVTNDNLPYADYDAKTNETNKNAYRNVTKRRPTVIGPHNSTENHHKFKKIHEQYTTGTISCIISDYSPDWSFVGGGVKVLITGPWTNVENAQTNSTYNKAISPMYTVLFDSVPVLTTLVQSGVLRCFSPPHDVGIALVEVSYGGIIISNAVTFEFKLIRGTLTEDTSIIHTPSMSTDMLSNRSDTLHYCSSLYIRLDAVDEWMYVRNDSGISNRQTMSSSMVDLDNAEDCIVNHCRKMMTKKRRCSSFETWDVSCYRGMTLLHLAAALGYSKLVCVFLAWRTENPGAILDTEIDALSQDYDGYTPLTWALAHGHAETARILYRWNKTAMNIRNKKCQTPLEVCSIGGFDNVVAEFKVLACAEKDKMNIDSVDEISRVQNNIFANKELDFDKIATNAVNHIAIDSILRDNDSEIFEIKKVSIQKILICYNIDYMYVFLLHDH